MKKKAILLLVILGVIAFLFWKLSNPPVTPTTEQSAPTGTTQTNNVTAMAPAGEPSPVSNFAAWKEKRMQQMQSDTEKVQNEWRTPIVFYGKAVDQDTNPVADAQVDFSCNDTSAEGTSFYHTNSDGGGLFSIKGIRGKLLGVNVSKEGYYPFLPNGDNFYYAGQNQNFVPDIANPVVFRLRKKGIGEPLIRFKKDFRIPKDGTPVEIDLMRGELAKSSENAIKIECWTHDTEKKEGWKYDWKCRISVPGGGLQIYNEQFPFEAPESGYVSEDNIDMTLKPGVGWSQDVQRNYYVQTASGKFGRIVFGMAAAGDHFCVINSSLNPNGSRVLEPQQQ